MAKPSKSAAPYSIMVLPLQILLLALLVNPGAAATCGRVLSVIDFESPRVSELEKGYPDVANVITDARGLSETRAGVIDKVPYTLTIANAHWTPNNYLAGEYGEKRTRVEPNTCMKYGFTSNRNSLALEDSNQVLEVDLPKNCISTGECALQSRYQIGVIAEPLIGGKLQEATLTYRFKFSKGFDWGLGGKLPGFCSGPTCVTGCDQANGNNGWSARHMWKKCNPNVASERGCQNKLSSYLYHKNKTVLCGDDWSLTDENGIFEPEDDRWYTLTSYIKMNTAGPQDEDDVHEADGIIKTWIDGRLLLSQTDMEWRNFDHLTIGFMYFSVFAGGNDYSWGSTRDNSIRFDDFVMTSGYCPPAGARETLPRALKMQHKPHKSRHEVLPYQVLHDADIAVGITIKTFQHMTDKKCWTKCLQNNRCQSVVMRRRGCDLKGTASEHLIVALPKARLMYPWSSRELSVPYLGWNDPGDLSRPEICPAGPDPAAFFTAPPGEYKWPTTAGVCQLATNDGPCNATACCKGVLVCLWREGRMPTCERPGEYRTADADPCTRVGLGEQCGNKALCCNKGLDCEFIADGNAKCTELRMWTDPFPPSSGK